MDVEAEIRDLKRRVGELEGSFGFLTQQLRGVHKDLLAFQAKTDERFDKVEARLDRIEGRFDGVESRLDRVEAEGRNLRHDLPGMVGNVMREVLREERERTGKK
jgi:hypothetical protein